MPVITIKPLSLTLAEKNLVRLEELSKQLSPLNPEVTMETFRKKFREPNHYIRGAFADGDLIGTATIDTGQNSDSATHTKSCEIKEIVLHETWRGSGVAAEQIGDLLKIARTQGANSVFVKTHETQIAINRLCYTLGFKRVGEEFRITL